MQTIGITKLLEERFPYSMVKRFNIYYRCGGRQRSKQEIVRFLGTNVSSREKRKHLRKMRQAYLLHSWRFSEYFLYHYDNLSRSGRKEFVSETEKNKFCFNVNPKSLRQLFRNKAETYYRFAQYYHRSVCELHLWEQDKDVYLQFVQEHRDYIVKPIDASVGRGVQILHGEQEGIIRDLLDEYRTGIVVEELIKQDPLMARPHPQSVNTVRITTFKVGDKTHILHPFMRLGCGDSIVDNAGSGGLFCALDLDTGIVFESVDENGKRYVIHPDTGIAIVGFQVPRWEEVVALAKELAEVLPKCRFVGWDFALTDKGWVMVEGNAHGQFLGFQLPRLQGARTELLSLDPDCFNKKVDK